MSECVCMWARFCILCGYFRCWYGGILREVLKHNTIEQVDQCEVDEVLTVILDEFMQNVAMHETLNCINQNTERTDGTVVFVFVNWGQTGSCCPISTDSALTHQYFHVFCLAWTFPFFGGAACVIENVVTPKNLYQLYSLLTLKRMTFDNHPKKEAYKWKNDHRLSICNFIQSYSQEIISFKWKWIWQRVESSYQNEQLILF